VAHRALTLLAVVSLAAWPPSRLAAQDTVEARRVFEANINAIHRRDRPAYLALYLDSPNFARNGPGGLQMGYAPMAASRDTTWPDSLIATDLRLIPIRPGVVYGHYRYRVTQRGITTNGVSERIFVRTPRGWRIAVSTAFGAPPGTAPAPIVLTGATVVDGTGRPPIPDAVVVVRGGRIACVGPRGSCPLPADAEPVRDTMDLAGRWIIPGLVDAHVHFGQTGWVDGRPDALDLRQRGFPYERTVADLERRPERFFRAYTCSGVTGVFDVGGYPWSWSLRERAERDLTAPHVAAAGPLLSTVDHYINLPDAKQILLVSSDSAARVAVRAHVARGTDAIKVWYIRRANADTAQQQAIINAAGDEARRNNVRLIVHATSLAAAKEALRAGAQLLVHSVEDQAVDEEFLQLARANNAVYNPTLTVRDGYRQVNLRHFEPHYPTSCVDSTTLAHARATDTIAGPTRTPEQIRQINEVGERRLRLTQENLLAVHRAGITVAMGTDAGNPLTLPGPSVYWEMEAMQAAGLTPMEVLVASTRNGARAMGRERDFGTLEAGKHADLVVLGADPTADIRNVREVRLVMRGGAMSTPGLLAPR